MWGPASAQEYAAPHPRQPRPPQAGGGAVGHATAHIICEDWLSWPAEVFKVFKVSEIFEVFDVFDVFEAIEIQPSDSEARFRMVSY